MTPSEQSYRLIPLTKGQFAKVDEGDYERLIEWHWHASWDPTVHSFYATRHSIKGECDKRITVTMHRAVMNCTYRDGTVVDHINHDTLDNRRHNLRLVTHAINSQNRKMHRDNTSGMTGVYFHRRDKIWFSVIIVNRERIHLGTFRDATSAHVAYVSAKAKYHAPARAC